MTALSLRAAFLVAAALPALVGTGNALAAEIETAAYVVHADSGANAVAAAEAVGARPTVTFVRAVAGFAAPLRPAQVDSCAAAGVLAVEEDRRFTPVEPHPVAGRGRGHTTQTRPTGAWTASTSARCRWTAATRPRPPEPCDHYVLDTGVDTAHPEFEGRRTRWPTRSTRPTATATGTARGGRDRRLPQPRVAKRAASSR